MTSRVIVLNNDYSILGTTSFKKAIRLLVKEKAVAIANSEFKIHKDLFAPLVIRLVKAIRNLWRVRVPWNKNNVFVRDNFICQYCGIQITKKRCTIDHIIPKAQGGKNKWDNTVCSCFKCNNTKGDRTPSEANMTLKKIPVTPTIMSFLLMKIEAEGLTGILKELGIY